jgi:hypothetical protein
MIENTLPTVPIDHPVRAMFQQLTVRGMSQIKVRDEETIDYVANLLTEFVRSENFYRVRDGQGNRVEFVCDILRQASQELSPELRREYYRYLGDWTMFTLGLFPEMFTRRKHTFGAGYYAEQGRRSYHIVADMDWANTSSNAVFRKLSEQFPLCVEGLHWIKLYINDPFYQYMFREFQVV